MSSTLTELTQVYTFLHMLRFLNENLNSILKIVKLSSLLSSVANIQTALNDLPTLLPNLVTNVTEKRNGSDRIFTITYSNVLGIDFFYIYLKLLRNFKIKKLNPGDAPLIKIGNTSLSVNISEQTKGFSSNSIQLLIENVPSPIINVYDTKTNVRIIE